LQPGAGAEPHSQTPLLQVAEPLGSFAQQRLASFPKQSGALPEHPGPSTVESTGAESTTPESPGVPSKTPESTDAASTATSLPAPSRMEASFVAPLAASPLSQTAQATAGQNQCPNSHCGALLAPQQPTHVGGFAGHDAMGASSVVPSAAPAPSAGLVAGSVEEHAAASTDVTKT
jgi:hypothetical protein